VRPSAKSGEEGARLTNIKGLIQGLERAFRRKILLLCLPFILLLQMLPTFANSGPPRILPEQNKVIFMENPGVALIHEHIKMEWDPEHYNAEVTVTYTFENTEDIPQALTLWFMSGDYEDRSFMIKSSRAMVPTKDIEPDAYHLENWAFERDPAFVTAYNETAQPHLEYYGQIQTPARITEWRLELDSRERSEVVIAYKAKSGYLNHSDYFTVYRTLYYALSPAQFFNGDAVLDFELIVPEDWSAAANLPLKLEAPGRYTLQDYIIGTEDLYLSLINTKELMFGLNSRAALFGRTWPVAAVSFIAAVLLARRRKRLAAGIAIVGAAILSLNVIRPSYGMIFMMMMFLPMVVATLVLIAAALFVHKRRRRKSAGDTPIDSNKPKD